MKGFKQIHGFRPITLRMTTSDASSRIVELAISASLAPAQPEPAMYAGVSDLVAASVLGPTPLRNRSVEYS